MDRLNGFLDRTCINVVKSCFNNPKKTILVATLIIFSLLAGWITIKTEKDAIKLWINPNLEFYHHHETINDIYEPSPAFIGLIVEPKHKDDNVIQKKYFDEAFRLFDGIMALNNYEIYDLCVQHPIYKCDMSGPLKFWMFNSTVYKNSVLDEESLKNTINKQYYFDWSPVYNDLDFAKYEQVYGKAFKIYMYTNTHEKEMYDKVYDWEDRLIEYLFEQFKSDHINVYMTSSISVDKELEKTLTNDFHLVLIVGVLVNTFSILNMRKQKDWPWKFNKYDRKTWMFTNIWMFYIVLILLSAFGFSMYLGMTFATLAQAIPFILISIGINNAFVMMAAFERYPTDIEKCIGKTGAGAGLSITLTSFTTCISFIFTTLDKTPSVYWFGWYAFFSMLFLYIGSMTVLPALIALMIDFEEQEVPEQVRTDYKKKPSYGKIIMKSQMKALVIFLFTFLTCSSIWNINNIEIHYDTIEVMNDKAYAVEYAEKDVELWGYKTIGTTHLYFKDLPFDTTEQQQKLVEITNMIVNTDIIDHSKIRIDLFQFFQQWLHIEKNVSIWQEGDNFKNYLVEFLNEPQYNFLLDYIVFNKDLTVKSMKTKMVNTPIYSTEQGMNHLDKLDEILGPYYPDIFTYNPFFISYEVSRHVEGNLYTTLLLSVTTVIFTSWIAMNDIYLTIVLTIVIGSMFINIYASLLVWGLNLNITTEINMVLSIGLVVDYSAHIMQQFSIQSVYEKRSKRVVDTIDHIAYAVFLGAMNTWLGILPLAFASSPTFRTFFKMLFSVVVVGITHGLLLIPILLSLVSKKLVKKTKKNRTITEETESDQVHHN